MATKSISQLDSAVSLALGDLFEIAEPDVQSQTGYASKKISMSQAAAYVQEDVSNANLNTTSKNLVGAINEVDSEVVKWSENNILGAKNLLLYPYMFFVRTHRGVTFSDYNGKGAIKANGQNDNTGVSFGVVTTIQLEAGSYIFTGGISADYYFGIRSVDSGGTETVLGEDTGSGFSFNVSENDAENLQYRFYVYVARNKNADNVIYYPMLRLASIADSTYEPYAETNRQLTTSKFDWNGQNVVGGKNLLIFPYTETYDTELTVVYLPNGGVKVSCSNISAIRLIRLQTRGQNTNLWLDPSKRYKISLVSDKKSASASECAVSLIYYNGSSNLQNATAYANGTETIVNVPSTTPNLIECYLLVPKSATLDNETFYPMIRNEEVLDGTWMPYADTNHGLSINKADMMQIATVETAGTASKAYAIGDYMIWRNGFYKVTAAISQGGAITRNTNVLQTTIAAELTALFAALGS